MVCIHCGGKTHVFNSRAQKRLNQVWRRRRCLDCGAVFSTEERAHYEAAWRVRTADGGICPFSREKLFLSLYKSCGHRPNALADATALCDTIIHKLAVSVTTGTLEVTTIIQAVQVALNRFDTAASTQYLAYHPSKI